MRRGAIVKTLRCCAELNCRECPLEKLREGRGCTTKLAKEVLKQMQADDAERRKQYAQTLPKAIAIDFDGCLCANAYPDIGAPNWEIIVAAAAEQIAGAGLILWTCREGELLENALEACAGIPDAAITLRAHMDKGYLVIQESNPVRARQPQGKKPRRIPELERGVGFRVLGGLAEKYDGSFRHTCENDTYTVTLSLRAG